MCFASMFVEARYWSFSGDAGRLDSLSQRSLERIPDRKLEALEEIARLLVRIEGVDET